MEDVLLRCKVCGCWWSTVRAFSGHRGWRREVMGSGMSGVHTRPTCRRGQGLISSGRLNRFSKQLGCDVASSNPGDVLSALRWRRTEAVWVGKERKDFNGFSFLLLLRSVVLLYRNSGTFCALLSCTCTCTRISLLRPRSLPKIFPLSPITSNLWTHA
jgi:hypothetical protein